MSQLQCPVCRAAAGGGYHLGDNTVFLCPDCGDYKLAGTAMRLFELGSLKKPDPEWFRNLVRQKRGDSADYPLITSFDLGG
jgi:hypothetical protein